MASALAGDRANAGRHHARHGGPLRRRRPRRRAVARRVRHHPRLHGADVLEHGVARRDGLRDALLRCRRGRAITRRAAHDASGAAERGGRRRLQPARPERRGRDDGVAGRTVSAQPASGDGAQPRAGAGAPRVTAAGERDPADRASRRARRSRGRGHARDAQRDHGHDLPRPSAAASPHRRRSGNAAARGPDAAWARQCRAHHEERPRHGTPTIERAGADLHSGRGAPRRCRVGHRARHAVHASPS